MPTKLGANNNGLELISNILTHENYDATELDKARITSGMMVMAREDTTEMQQASEQSLDLPTSFIAAQYSAILNWGLGPIPAT